MKKYITFITFLVTMTIIAAQCGAAPTQEPVGQTNASPSSGIPKIKVTDPWARASAMKGGNGAVYMTLMNQGNNGDVLLGVQTDVAEVAELHESKMEGDVMKMAPISNIELPAGSSVALETGGKHVMLINLKQELIPGETILLTLNFDKYGPMIIRVKVQEEGGEMEMDHKAD